jgi:hypothetical protein
MKKQEQVMDAVARIFRAQAELDAAKEALAALVPEDEQKPRHAARPAARRSRPVPSASRHAAKGKAAPRKPVVRPSAKSATHSGIGARPGSVYARVADYLDSIAPQVVRAGDVAPAIKVDDVQLVRTVLYRLARAGRIAKAGVGAYQSNLSVPVGQSKEARS